MAALSDEEKRRLRERFPAHWFCKVIRNGDERIVAIPKSDPPRDIPSMPGMTTDLLHGSTVRLTSADDEELLKRQFEGAA